jgi:hypothetical protein
MGHTERVALMDDEQKALRDMDRSAKAAGLLNNEMLMEAFAHIDGELIGRWRACKDAEGRDRIWQATQITSRVQEILRMVLENGKIAKAILDDLEGKRRRKAA